MDVSVIIVNYNTTRLTEDCIASIHAHCRACSYEIIVVDNASPDRSIENITRLFPVVQLINNAANLGFGAANNIGIRRARGEFIFLLNSDTVLQSDALAAFVHYLRQPENKKVAVCGGELYTGTSKPATSFGNFPGIFQAISSLGLFYLYPSYYRKHLDTGVCNYDQEVKKVDVVSGASFMVRASVLQEVGVFDEDFFMYFEETELSWRIQKADYISMLLPAVKILHYEGASTNQIPGSFNYDTYRHFVVSRQLFFRKVHGRFQSQLAKFLFLLQLLLKTFAGKERGNLSKKCAILLLSTKKSSQLKANS